MYPKMGQSKLMTNLCILSGPALQLSVGLSLDMSETHFHMVEESNCASGFSQTLMYENQILIMDKCICEIKGSVMSW